jgi:transcriptional regulator with XRE-family HTH domain
MPGIIRFLGYNPLPEANTFGERLVRQRTMLGLTQKETAQELGVDQGTLARWERDEQEPKNDHLRHVEQLLAREGQSATEWGCRDLNLEFRYRQIGR